MKTALLLSSLGLGGAERVGSHILKYYSDNSKEIILILFEKNIKLRIPKNVKVFYLSKNSKRGNFLNFLMLPPLAYKLSNIFKTENINICLSLTTRPNYVNILSSIFFNRGVKYTISERCCPSVAYAGNSMKSLINRFLIKKLYAKSRKIICNSIGNKNDLIHKFNLNKDKIVVINNPLDFEIIKSAGGNKNIFDTRLINFLSVGRLDKNKNFEMMIRTVSKIRDESVRLYIIGSGSEYANLKNLIISLRMDHRIFLEGEKKNVFSYFKSADAFLFTSRSEGFPNVLMESLACETFIISHNCIAGPDEIIFDKIIKSENIVENQFGMITPFNDEEKFLEAVKSFIENIEVCGSKKGANHHRKIHKYELSGIVNQISAFIEQ